MNAILNWNNYEFLRDPGAVEAFQIEFDDRYREHFRGANYYIGSTMG